MDRASANHVTFTYALSPGATICYSSDADTAEVIKKLQAIWDIGVRAFSIHLDDLSQGQWNCDGDSQFGTVGDGQASAQSYFVNRINDEFIHTHAGAMALQIVPTEYSDINSSTYKSTIAAQLEPDVIVGWTGVGIAAETISVSQAQAAVSLFGHPILLWDNFPVNDFSPGNLHLGPIEHRDDGLGDVLGGITSNPMNQASASKLALFTVADYAWNSAAYDADRSWKASLHEFAGGDSEVEDALRRFGDLFTSSPLDAAQAPQLSHAFADFWSGKMSAGALDRALQRLGSAPNILRKRVPEATFAGEVELWLDACEAWTTAARAALSMLVAAHDMRGADAWRIRQQLPDLMSAATAFAYHGHYADYSAVCSNSIFTEFILTAEVQCDRSLGIVAPQGFTNLEAYNDSLINNIVDSDDSTFFWNSKSVSANDYVGVELGAVYDIGHIKVVMSKADRPGDYIHQAILEYSTDNQKWTELGDFESETDIEYDAPPGTRARYVRVRAWADQPNWLVVRTFRVEVLGIDPTISGGPAAIADSSFSQLADQSVDDAYTASGAPSSGETLELTYSESAARALVVLQPDGAATARAAIDANMQGVWQHVGELSGPYTRVELNTSALDAIRFDWEAGSPPPEIVEVAVDRSAP